MQTASSGIDPKTLAAGLTHIEILITDLIFPYVATLVMTLIESLIESLGWQMRMVKSGWDLCMLSLGAGGIFATPAMVNQWQGQAVIWALTSLLVSLLCGLVIMHVRKGAKTKPTGLRGVTSFVLGSISVALPIYFALHLGG